MIEQLINKKFTSATINEDKTELTLENEDEAFVFYHENSCCERVWIADVDGELEWLTNMHIVDAEESESPRVTPPGVKLPEENPESYTWTFYKFITMKGYVTIRFYGSSNGYYSETAEIKHIDKRNLHYE